jgi:hypothetical protein
VRARRRFPLLSALAAGALLAAAPAVLAGAHAAPGDVSSQQNDDGSWTTTLTASADTWVDSSSKTSQSTSPELRVGSANYGFTKARTYLQFDTTSLAGKPAAAVMSAQVQLSDFYTGSCKGSAIRVSRVTGTWAPSTLNWSKQPATSSTGSSTSSSAYGASACPAEGTMSFDATAIVKAWLGGSANNGLQVKADSEASAAGVRKFRSLEATDAAKAPKLVITYNTTPPKPTGVGASPSQNGYVSSTTTPTVSAIIIDPDGGKVRGYFEVYNSDGSQKLWSGYSDWGTSGDSLGATVDPDILTDGSYVIAAYAEDPMYRSLSATLKTIKIDSTAPTVVITATAFTDGAWTDPAPGSNTFTIDGPADTQTFAILIDGWYPVAAYPSGTGSGDFTFDWVPAKGWHTVAATATDKAGNAGPTTTFSFGVGPQPTS